MSQRTRLHGESTADEEQVKEAEIPDWRLDESNYTDKYPEKIVSLEMLLSADTPES